MSVSRSRSVLLASLFLVCVVLYNTHSVGKLLGAALVYHLQDEHHHQRQKVGTTTTSTTTTTTNKPDPPPSWFTKYDFVTESAQQHAQELARMPDICFLHVGKTAGTSLRCAFGFREGFDDCRNTTVPAGFFLPLATTHLMHNELNDCPAETDTNNSNNNNNNKQQQLYYLFATRNPLHRIVSWYTYEYPKVNERSQRNIAIKKPLYVDCPFDTLEKLAVLGLGERNDDKDDNDNVVVSETCRKRAWDAIHGYERYARHNYYNYRHYLSQVPDENNDPWFVIRTEHLVDDWNSVEAHLAAHLNDNSSTRHHHPYKIDESAFPRTNPTPQTDKERERKRISPTAQELLCAALCHEIQIYKTVLRRAINLTPKDVDISLKELAESCPQQTSVEKCPPEVQPVVKR